MIQLVKQKQTVTVAAYRQLETNSTCDLATADILLIIIFAFWYVVSKLLDKCTYSIADIIQLDSNFTQENAKMPKKSRSCKNDPDTFCYICGELTLLKYRRNLTDKIKHLYYACFGCAVGDQDKVWSPHYCCLDCSTLSLGCSNNSLKA